MKSCIQLLLLSITISCNAQKNSVNRNSKSKAIVYLLPYYVDSVLTEQIGSNDKDIYFHLSGNGDEYTVYIGHYNKKYDYKIWVANTNRKLFLNGRFYPLVFEMDEIFGTTETEQEIVKSHMTEKFPLINRTVIMCHCYYVKFKRDGEILSAGLDGTIKKN